MSILGKILSCVLIADFLTGFVHWLEDTYGVPNMPLIGKSVIEPNIEHHQNPSLIGKMGTIFSRNTQPVLIGLALLAGTLVFGLFSWWIVLILALAALGNEVHTWNHRRNNNAVIVFLQRSGLVQSRHQHNLHHKPPYDKYYCTLTSFTNEVLETINFWRRLEWLLSCIGIHPKRMGVERGGY